MFPRMVKFLKFILAVFLTLLLIKIIGSRYNTRLSEHSSTLRFERPLVFIGGMPRSGTTLMRAILDVHPMVRCGEETIVVPKLSSILKYSEKQARRYNEAKISQGLLYKAIGLAILTIIEGHGPQAYMLCNKDPFTMEYGIQLTNVFENSKFIFMIRDGRAVVSSIISRGVTVSGFNLSNYAQCLKQWSKVITDMKNQCSAIGLKRCLPVKYENLVLQPKTEISRIVDFLGLKWNDKMLKHHDAVGKEISVSKLEWSNDQIAKPINTDALTKWVRSFPVELKTKVPKLAPALQELGYDPFAFPPDYGVPDELVRNNTLWLETNKTYWNKVIERFRRK